MKIRYFLISTLAFIASATFLKAQLAMPLTFDEAMEFTFTDFGPDLEGGRPVDKVTNAVADPDNAENMVAGVIKPARCRNMVRSYILDGTKVPVSESKTKISVRVRTLEANTPILLKIENSLSPSHFVEKMLTQPRPMSGKSSPLIMPIQRVEH